MEVVGRRRKRVARAACSCGVSGVPGRPLPGRHALPLADRSRTNHYVTASTRRWKTRFMLRQNGAFPFSVVLAKPVECVNGANASFTGFG